MHYRVPGLMDDMVNTVNRDWGESHPIRLSAYVLWRLNWIHPFVNGNGRTARDKLIRPLSESGYMAEYHIYPARPLAAP